MHQLTTSSPVLTTTRAVLLGVPVLPYPTAETHAQARSQHHSVSTTKTCFSLASYNADQGVALRARSPEMRTPRQRQII